MTGRLFEEEERISGSVGDKVSSIYQRERGVRVWGKGKDGVVKVLGRAGEIPQQKEKSAMRT